MTTARAGLVLSGKYRLDTPIGRGGMGWVWKAEHLQWHAPVAVKLIDLRRYQPATGAVDDSPELQRFFSEARSAATIRSPHVVQILDHGVDETSRLPFIVMELLEGETLEQRLDREVCLAPPVAANLLSQAARALTRVHEAKMVHRDLKPSNVFLVPNEEELVVKVLDFGIAKSRGGMTPGPITATGEQMGTPFYMSPEQVRGERDIDLRADIWAFGVIAFECLTGKRPFNGETLGALSLNICVEPLPRPSSVAPVPPHFDDWFSKCVDRDRERRFASAREAADALRRALSAAAVSQRISRATPRGGPSGTVRILPAENPMASTTSAVSSSRGRGIGRKKRLTATAVGVALAAGLVALAIDVSSRQTPEGGAASPSPSLSTASAATAQPPQPESPRPTTTNADAAGVPGSSLPSTQRTAEDPKPRSVATPGALIAKPKPRPPKKDSSENSVQASSTGRPNDPPEPPSRPASLHDLIESRY